MRKSFRNTKKLKSKKSLNSTLFNDTQGNSNLKSNSKNKSLSKSLNTKENDLSYYLNRIEDYTGFFTTQQLNNIDFSRFENHVFFDSAVDKINFSIKKILNDFPYDRSELGFTQYINTLDGYTSYLLKSVIPKNLGYIKFDGNNKIEVKDQSGAVFKNGTGESKKTGYLDPEINSYTFDFWIKPSSTANNQVVVQKKSGNFGYTVYLNSYDAASNKININIIYSTDSGSIFSTQEINYNSWNHININITKKRAKRFFTFHINGQIKKDNTIGQIALKEANDSFKAASLFIGSGTDHGINVSGTVPFVGFIDNFRVFNRMLSSKEIITFKENDIHSSISLILSLPFNEPSGEYINNDIVLDHSGNKLDGIIKTISGNRINAAAISSQEYKVIKGNHSNDSHIKYEKLINHPVRFPSFVDNIAIHKELISKGLRYDKINPNIFYKLFPKNLFAMTSEFENKEFIYIDNGLYTQNEDSTKIITPDSSSIIQIMAIWSRFFDQLKMYIDAFSEMINLDYDSINKEDVLGMFLPTIVKKMGFEFKELIPVTLKSKLDNKHLTHEEAYSDMSIRHIQNELWKRFLINSQDFLRSKGTKKSIRSVFNSMGIDSNRFITIREFNGKNLLNTKTNFLEYLQKYNFIDFGNSKNISLLNNTLYSSGNKYPENKYLLEIGEFSENSIIFDDDWSIEFFVKYNNNFKNILGNQSLLRVERSSEALAGTKNRPLIDVKYIVLENKLELSIAEGNTSDLALLTKKSILLENIDLFSGSNYYICVQRKIQENNSILYNFIAYESNYPYSNTKSISNKTEFRFNLEAPVEKEITSNISSIVVGPSNPDLIFSNEGLGFPIINTNFEGKFHSLKLWKKYLSRQEINSHKIDQRSFGLENPKDLFEIDNLIFNLDLRQIFKSKDNDEYKILLDGINEFSINNSSQFFNYILPLDDTPIAEKTTVFNDTLTGKIEEIRSNIYCEAKIKSSANLSLNYSNLGEIVKSESSVIKKNNIKIDEPVIFNGVNINYFEDSEYNEIFGISNKDKKFELDSRFEIDNDIRCSIDFSNVNFLNKEISNLLSYNEFLNNSLNKSFAKYDYSYKELEYMREKFFNMFELEIDFNPLFQVYKYFDNIMSDLLFQAIPSRVNYLGFNFVYESHALERHKYTYKMKENRLPVVENPLNVTSNKNIILVDNQKNALKYRNQEKTEHISNHVFQR